MPGAHSSSRSRRKNTVRWIVFAIILCSAMSCIAPVLYATTDCSRWLAEYKQGILQRRAARRLRFARYRLTTVMRRKPPVHPHPMLHRMSPLESLRRFQIDCGEIETPPPPPGPPLIKWPLLPVEPTLTFISFAEVPPELPPPTTAEITVPPVVPPLINVPTTPVETASAPPVGPVPEPDTFLLVLTGAGGVVEVIRRRRRSQRLD